GGLTTLGANAVSMAITGPGLAWGSYQLFRLMGKPKLALFGAVALANLGTYLVTALQLALAFPDAQGGILTAFGKFAGIFAVTQIPLAITEGLLTVLVWNWLQDYAQEELLLLQELRG
ncbi:MAG: energy-coupling factor ABC transporter permease, partial [Microcystaceae cyanobacterium]